MPIERTPAPVKSSTCTAQKQNAPPTTQRNPQRRPTGKTQKVPVIKETMSSPTTMPNATQERYAQDENLGHALSGTIYVPNAKTARMTPM